MTDIGEGIWFKLGLDTTGLETGLNNATKGMREWRDQTNENTRDMAKWGAAIAATVGPLAAATAATRRLVDEYGGMAQELNNLSLITGISTESLQEFKYTATLSGTDFHTVSVSLNRLTLSMQEARDSTSEAGKAFAMLGVSPTGKTPAQVIDETSLALMAMEDITARNKIAMELYGKSWSELIPYMDTYIRNRDEIRAHVTISEDELQALGNAKTGWDKIGDAIYNAGAKATATAIRMQTAANAINPIAKLFGFITDTSWDQGPNPLITPAAADPNKRTIFDTTDYSKEGGVDAGKLSLSQAGHSQAWINATQNTNGWIDFNALSQASFAAMTSAEQSVLVNNGYNPYGSNNARGSLMHSARDTQLIGVGTYNTLLSELNVSPWISPSVKSQYGALATTNPSKDMSNLILYGDTNSAEYIKASMNAFGGMASREELYDYYLAGRGGGVEYTVTQQELDAKIKALRATLSSEWGRMQRYQAAIGSMTIVTSDPLAAAAAISRLLADKANQAGVT